MTTDEHRKKGHWIAYHGAWDTYWCLTCGVWTEPTCGDDDCMFCAERPPYPSWGPSGMTVTTSSNFKISKP